MFLKGGYCGFYKKPEFQRFFGVKIKICFFLIDVNRNN